MTTTKTLDWTTIDEGRIYEAQGERGLYVIEPVNIHDESFYAVLLPTGEHSYKPVAKNASDAESLKSICETLDAMNADISFHA